ncbi:MAG: hypothetical protein ACE5QV_01600 [Fidelibacterota bacterium]
MRGELNPDDTHLSKSHQQISEKFFIIYHACVGEHPGKRSVVWV